MKKLTLAIVFISLFYQSSVFADATESLRDPFQKTVASQMGLKTQSDGKISLDFNNINSRELLQLLAQIAGKNLVMDEEVQGNLSLHLQNVTWQQAFDTVVLMKNLSWREQANIIFVSGKAVNNAQLAISTKLLRLRYAKAIDLVTSVKNAAGLLSPTGVISADPRTNSLWIEDTPEKLAMVQNLIQRLDIPVKQVIIKARIVNVDKNWVQELGIKFGTTTQNNLSLDGLGMDMPVSISSNGHFNIAVAKLGANTLLDLELSALESEGHGKVISSPELITADRVPAYIEAGEEVPYQEKTSSGATNVAFKKAVLSLKVVPQITPQNHIILDLTVNQDRLSAIIVNGVPAIQTREIQTQVAVNNGQTLVLGGIYEQTESNNVERIPFLGSLPVVGGFFSNKVVKSERKELLIFVTPQVVD